MLLQKAVSKPEEHSVHRLMLMSAFGRYAALGIDTTMICDASSFGRTVALLSV
jgi:hypothetical protein